MNRLENETDFEHKLRLCKMKINKELDLDWQEIVDYLKLDISADHLRKISYGYLEYDDYINNNGVANRILTISDTHIPYQIPVDTFKDFSDKVDILVLNGDILDCQSLSKFPKTYRVSTMEEMIIGRQYMVDLINLINPKKVVITYGNHDIRLMSYLSKQLDNDVIELMPNTGLELIFEDGFNHYDKRIGTKTWYKPLKDIFTDIEINYTGNWFCKVGKTLFCHPKAFSSGILKTAEKAMYYFRNEGHIFTSLVMAHTHRIGEFKIGNTTIYEQGTCSDVTKLHYSDGELTNSQKMGYMYICQDQNGEIIKDKTKLISLN